MRVTLVLATVIVAVAIAACGGPSSSFDRGAAQHPLEQSYPVLRHVPGDAGFAMVAPLRSAVQIAAELQALRAAAELMSAPETSVYAEVIETLAGFGGGQGKAAVFGAADELSILWPVSDKGVQAALDRLDAEFEPSTIQHREQQVYSVTRGRQISWVFLGDWVAARLGSPGGEIVWLERVLDAPGREQAVARRFGPALELAQSRGVGPVGQIVLGVGESAAALRKGIVPVLPRRRGWYRDLRWRRR